MPEKFIDPYIDQNTGILRNLVGAATYDELNNAEGEFVALRTGEFLTKLPMRVSGTMRDFQELHRFLFQDILSGLTDMFLRIVSPSDREVPLNSELISPGHLK